MNILFQVCGLLVIVILFVIYKRQKTLHLFRDQIFTVVMVNAICVLATDALSVVAIYYMSALPQMLVDAACKLYLCAMTCFGFSALFYVLVDAIDEKKRIKLLNIGFIVITLQLLSIIFSPIQIVNENGIIYTKWISVYLCYAYTLIYILSTIAIAFKCHFKNNRRRAIGILSWMCVELVAAVIQLLKPDFLVVAFAGALGILILYVMLQTPESNLDKQYDCFNSYSFDVFTKDRKDYDVKFCLLEIKIIDKKLMKESYFDPIKTPMKVINWISKHSKVLIFKNVDFSLILVSNDINELKMLLDEFQKFILPYKVENEISFVLVESSDYFENSVDLQHLIEFKHSTEITQKHISVIDEDTLTGYKQEILIADEVRKALDEDRVCVYFQPIYSFISNKFNTAEALVRVIDSNGDIMMPGKFIPICEKNGLILEVGNRVFEKVCEFIATHNTQQLGIEYIEVNLSVVQCENCDLASQIIDKMKEYNINTKLINFEITETGSVKTRIQLLENMNKLYGNGVEFSLDDFGKGESNLGYLIDMPVSILKLDMDITKAYKTNEKARNAIEHIVKLAHNIGIRVVAEGIENQEELDNFKRIGVDYIQGYVFSKPIPVNEYVEFLGTYNNYEL